jgi:hypothetical protein
VIVRLSMGAGQRVGPSRSLWILSAPNPKVFRARKDNIGG